MKNRKIVTLLAIVALTLNIYSQENTVVSGGTIAKLSYSIGQLNCTSKGSGGTTTSGNQQPYEISVKTGIENKNINVSTCVYPNPTTDYINLKLNNYDGVSYELYDTQGKIIETQKTASNETSISMVSLNSSVYLLKVTKNGFLLKEFQIIKK